MRTILVLLCLFAASPEWRILVDEAALDARNGNYLGAEKTLRAALAAVHEAGGSPSEEALVLNNLGGVEMMVGEYAQAEKILNRSLMLFLEVQPGDTDWTAPLNYLAILYHETGRLKESEVAYRRTLAARRAAFGSNHPAVAGTEANLASVLIDRNSISEAEQLLRSAIGVYRQVAKHQPDLGVVLINLAALRVHQGDLKRASVAAEEAVNLLKASNQASQHWLWRALLNLGRIQLDLGETRAAEGNTKEAVEHLRLAFPSGHPLLAEALFTHAEALKASGKKREARGVRKEGERMSAAYPSSNRYTISASALRAGKRSSR